MVIYSLLLRILHLLIRRAVILLCCNCVFIKFDTNKTLMCCHLICNNVIINVPNHQSRKNNNRVTQEQQKHIWIKHEEYMPDITPCAAGNNCKAWQSCHWIIGNAKDSDKHNWEVSADIFGMSLLWCRK